MTNIELLKKGLEARENRQQTESPYSEAPFLRDVRQTIDDLEGERDKLREHDKALRDEMGKTLNKLHAAGHCHLALPLNKQVEQAIDRERKRADEADQCDALRAEIKEGRAELRALGDYDPGYSLAYQIANAIHNMKGGIEEISQKLEVQYQRAENAEQSREALRNSAVAAEARLRASESARKSLVEALKQVKEENAELRKAGSKQAVPEYLQDCMRQWDSQIKDLRGEKDRAVIAGQYDLAAKIEIRLESFDGMLGDLREATRKDGKFTAW